MTRLQPLLLCASPRAACPVLTLAAVHAVGDDDPVLLAMPSGHAVARAEPFLQALEQGAVLAQDRYVVAFGTPLPVDAGQGILRAGVPVPGQGGTASYVDAFVEDASQLSRIPMRPERLFGYSGILMVRASVWIEALACLHKDILASCEGAYRRSRPAGGIWRLDDTRERAGNLFAVLKGLAALGSPAGASPESVVVRTEAAGTGLRAWDLVGASGLFRFTGHQLLGRAGDDDAVLLEIPGYAQLLQAA